MLTRRSFIKDCFLLCAAPAIVKIASIMPVKVIEPVIYPDITATSLSAKLWENRILKDIFQDGVIKIYTGNQTYTADMPDCTSNDIIHIAKIKAGETIRRVEIITSSALQGGLSVDIG